VSRASTLLRRGLRPRRARRALAALGIAASALLVLSVLGAYRSLTACVRAYAGRADVDLWVAPPGSDNLVRSTALLPAGPSLAAIRGTPGVRRADAIVRGFVRAEVRGRRPLTLLALGTEGLGGPPRLARGRAPRRAGEVAFDRAAAAALAVEPGDSIRLDGGPVRVVGITRGTNLLATQLAFLTLDGLAETAGVRGAASFVLVQGARGVPAATLARRLEARVRGVRAFDRATFLRNNVREVAAGFLPLLALVSLLSLGVAILLVGLLLSGAVDDRRTEIAVLLAIGAGPGRLAVELVRGAVSLVGTAGALGALSAAALATILDRALPAVELSVEAGDVASVLGAFAVAGAIAAALPVLRLRHVDPLEAFRP